MTDQKALEIDAATIIAGIRQFGLAADGSDLRDLETLLAALHPAPDAREAGLRNIRTIIEEWREGKPTGASDFAMGRIMAILINLLSPAPVGEKVETDGSEREIDWNEPASRSP